MLLQAPLVYEIGNVMSEHTSVNSPNDKDLKVKLPEPQIDENNLWRDDKLKRKAIGDNLEKLLDGETDTSLVVSLNGSWGCGKTFFLQRWEKDLKKKRYHTIYFNAWEDDFHEDPLIALTGQLVKCFESEKNKEIKKLMKAIKKGIPNILFSAVAGLTNLPITDIQKIIKNAKNPYKKAVDSYNESHALKQELNTNLKKLAKKIKKETGHPLIFIIDELDRCRPLFSIALLERVKHILDISDMHFVFGVNQEQLEKSIQAVYGNIEAPEYLQRFFDVEVQLPLMGSHAFCCAEMQRHNLIAYYKEMAKSESGHEWKGQDFEMFFPVFCEAMGLSLREIQHALRLTVLVSKQTQEQQFIYPFLLAALLLLKLKNRDLYDKYIAGQCLAAEVLNYFEQFLIGKEVMLRLQQQGIEPYPLLNRFRVTIYLTSQDKDLQIINEQIKLMQSQSTLDNSGYLSKATQDLNDDEEDHFTRLYFSSRRTAARYGINFNTLDYLVKKIRVLEPFKIL